MSEVIAVSAGQRRAALTLHALAAPDREWLLEQLPAADRAALRALLAELQELGIPADVEIIRSALSEATPGAGSAMPNAQAHAQVLAREMEALRGPLMSLLGAERREAVLAHWPLTLDARPAQVSQPTWTPRLKNALLKSWLDLAAEEHQA